MRNFFLVTAIFSFLLGIVSCSTSKEWAKKNVFAFSIDQNNYQIISLNTQSGEGTNYLAQINENGQQVFLARDLNQDGSIDLILKSYLSIEDANLIYFTGIDKAKNMGSYTEKASLRTFEYQKEQLLFTIKTYQIEKENASNLLLIFDTGTNTESIFLDSNADGILDSIEKGSMDLTKANYYYKAVLKKGIEMRKIELRKTGYWVKETNITESATALNNF